MGDIDTHDPGVIRGRVVFVGRGSPSVTAGEPGPPHSVELIMFLRFAVVIHHFAG